MIDELTAIERALDADDLETAAALAEAVLARGVRDPLIFNLAAWKAEAAGRLNEAETILREALDRYPKDPSLHLALGVTLRSLGRLREAVDAFDAVLALDPRYAAAWQERGATFERGGAIGDAIADFRQAVALEAANASALAALAMALARHGEMAESRLHADHALAIDPSNIQVKNACARIAIDEQRYEDAIAMLDAIDGRSDRADETLIGAYTLLGDAYDGAERFDAAYGSYERAQAIFQSIHAARAGDDHRQPQDFVDAIAASFSTADKTCWTGAVGLPDPVKTHVILTGYPRSGTTLVENILATLPSALAIEERPTLADVDPRFLTDLDGLGRFAALPESELDEMRQRYWARAERAAGEALKDRMFIDMDPFKGAQLPLIARLFPSAKIVLMRRDPRDVVWSCFRTSFAYNAGTMAFTTLEGTARHYARTWEIIEEALASLPINAFDLRYDALVKDFDATTQALCAHLGIPWTENLRQFDQTAKRRGVSTASVSQVRRGLYDGSGGWLRYADRLAAVEPILAPWIARFEAAGKS